MPRTTLTKSTAPGNYPTDGVAITLTAADVANQNQFLATGKELVVAYNSGAAPHTVTITSAADETGRTSHITGDSIAAGAMHMYGPFPLHGWVQSGTQYVYLEANHAEILFGIIQLP